MLAEVVMRHLLLSLGTAGLLVVLAEPARAQEDPRAIVERAVKALGGLDKITQVKAVHRRSRGVYLTENSPFTVDSFSQDPGLLKLIIQSRDPDNPSTRVLVLEGDKGWLSMGGVVTDFDEELQTRFKKARHADRVSGLVALLRDKEKRYTLTALGESQVKGKPAVGVKVAAQGQPDISLFFDKATGLLVKSSQRTSEAKVDNDALHEWYFSDYKVLDPAAADDAVLKAAKLGVDGPALVAYLRQRTPGPQTRERVKTLLGQLGATAFRDRTRATEELKKLGPEVASLLRPALKDADREVVRRVEQCLDHYARQPEAPLVLAALRLLALRRPSGTAAAVLAYLPWAPDEKTMDEARAALAAVALKGGKPDALLVRALQDANPNVRQAAAAALGRDGGAYERLPGRRVIALGLRYASRVELFRDGKREMEIEVLEIHTLNRLDDRIFARP
jgi:hypothetical protein